MHNTVHPKNLGQKTSIPKAGPGD